MFPEFFSKSFFDFNSPFVFGSTLALVARATYDNHLDIALFGTMFLSLNTKVRKYFNTFNVLGYYILLDRFLCFYKIHPFNRYNVNYGFFYDNHLYRDMSFGIFLSGLLRPV